MPWIISNKYIFSCTNIQMVSKSPHMHIVTHLVSNFVFRWHFIYLDYSEQIYIAYSLSWTSQPSYAWHVICLFLFISYIILFSRASVLKIWKENWCSQVYLWSHRAKNPIYVFKSGLPASRLHMKLVAIRTKNA